MNTDRPLPLQSVHRALDLLEALADEKDGLGLTALARRVGLKPSTAGNILRALLKRGFVEQRPGSTDYVLGSQLLTLAGRSLNRLDIARLAQHPLQQLHAYSGETVFLSARQGAYLTNLTVIDGIHPIIARAERRPRRANLHATAMGKVLLAYLDETAVDAAITEAGLPALTDQTITEPTTLKAHLAEVRRNGYALNHEEESPGVCGIAAPVFDHLGGVVAGVCVGYPAERDDQIDKDALIARVLACATEISRALGYAALPADRNGAASPQDGRG